MTDKPLDLTALQALADAATQGPWWFDEDDLMWRLHGVHARIPSPLGLPDQVLNHQILKAPKKGTTYAEYWPDAADAAFITAARTAVPALIAELAQLRTLVDEVYHLHTDSPAGVCPSCGRIGEQSDCDDGLVNWPCPTVQAIERVVGAHHACPTRAVSDWSREGT